MALLTVGHGTLPADAFAELLAGARVSRLVDVRAHPGSRRHPQFRRDAMGEWLAQHGVAYRWEPRLGGRRRPVPNSPHVAWDNASFRAYADHVNSAEFRAAIDAVVAESRDAALAVMCAESVWWRCHRQLIADALTVRHGLAVEHLFHDGRREVHTPSRHLRLEGGRDDDRLVYDVGVDRPLS